LSDLIKPLFDILGHEGIRKRPAGYFVSALLCTAISVCLWDITQPTYLIAQIGFLIAAVGCWLTFSYCIEHHATWYVRKARIHFAKRRIPKLSSDEIDILKGFVKGQCLHLSLDLTPASQRLVDLRILDWDGAYSTYRMNVDLYNYLIKKFPQSK
jgi:hypothetical protein